MPDTKPGCGGDFWTRRTNTYPGCTCPPARYDPRRLKPTNTDCPTHGETRAE